MGISRWSIGILNLSQIDHDHAKSQLIRRTKTLKFVPPKTFWEVLLQTNFSVSIWPLQFLQTDQRSAMDHWKCKLAAVWGMV